MAKGNGKRSGKRAPTPAKAGDTLSTIATFNLSRDLYEAERKEVYIAVRDRLSELKSQRKKTADALEIPVAEEKQIGKRIEMYEGDDGLLALFQNEEEEEEHTAEEIKKGGKDRRQRELPIDKVPSGSTEETKASTDPVGVKSIDDLVAHAKPFAPSDLDWDAFRREAVNMSGDERMAIHEYAERWHQHTNAPPSAGTVAPSIPSHLHTLFVDLSPAYATALGSRDDVLWKTDMERAMARGKAKKARVTADATRVDHGLTTKQLQALRAVAAGAEGGFGLSPSMWGKLMTLGVAYVDKEGQRVLTDTGRAAIAVTISVPVDEPTGEAPKPDGVLDEANALEIPASPAGLTEEEMLAVAVADDLADAHRDRQEAKADAEHWGDEQLRVPAEEPVAPLTAIAAEESTT